LTKFCCESYEKLLNFHPAPDGYDTAITIAAFRLMTSNIHQAVQGMSDDKLGDLMEIDDRKAVTEMLLKLIDEKADCGDAKVVDILGNQKKSNCLF
jgi:DNA integrity scanning protein DisA with diadenylate cyclase activity